MKEIEIGINIGIGVGDMGAGGVEEWAKCAEREE